VLLVHQRLVGIKHVVHSSGRGYLTGDRTPGQNSDSYSTCRSGRRRPWESRKQGREKEEEHRCRPEKRKKRIASVARDTHSAPAATAGRTACHRRPALIEPPPPLVLRRPGHPSRPGRHVLLRRRQTSSPPTLSLFPTSTGAAASASCAASGLVDPHRRCRPRRHRLRRSLAFASNAGQCRCVKEGENQSF
jgi:hypothetical protein